MTFKESTKKFRAYDTKNEKFAFVGFHIIGEVTLLGALDIYKHENSLSLDETLELKITQFTGLLDSKGVEIYEGDILQITQDDGNLGVVLVEGINGEYCCKGSNISVPVGYILALCGGFYIGNIYENANLLN